MDAFNNSDPNLELKEFKYRRITHLLFSFMIVIAYLIIKCGSSDFPTFLENILPSKIFVTMILKIGFVILSILSFYFWSYSSKRSLFKNLFKFEIGQIHFEISFLKPYLYVIIFICMFEFIIFIF